MHDALKACHSHTALERYILSHMPPPDELLPRPCTAPGCTFGHSTSSASAELATMLATEAELTADSSKAGKARFSRWRMAHAASHANVQPGKYGQPMHNSNLDDHILDSLHLAKLGLPKTPWKFGVMNDASDDARAAISEQLAVWKHPLDCRRKDNNRVRENKWFTGERWTTFCAGERGSP
eukprot:94947-Pleurochrysis_carterae.AAC.1